MSNSNTLADFVYTTEMNGQALAVLAVLSKMELHDSWCPWDKEYHRYKYYQSTAPWYNGREIGFILSVNHSYLGEQINIVCVECRNSDSIVVYTWGGGGMLNPLTIQDWNDDIYSKGYHFPYLDIKAAVEHIEKLIKDHFNSLKRDF